MTGQGQRRWIGKTGRKCPFSGNQTRDVHVRWNIKTQMTDVVTSTSSSHQEQHTDETSRGADGATDTTQSESDGENADRGIQGELKDRNPEPPPELLKERILDADNIGGTVFSKHWLFTTLMKLIQAVDSENESKDAKPTYDSGLDLEDSLQDELCNLWDMSMNPEVVSFLQDFKAVDILTGVIAKSRAPRATEICVGILGNMACNEQACREISAHERLVELLLMLLESPDAPTLIELTRLLRVCVSMDAAVKTWTTAIKKTDSVFTSILFILQSSTNSTWRYTSELA
ncbi:Protein saal1 [Lamellibrachia satsuma]|nr:Protein saal1 [Lamellibrachia satsuma]